MRQGNGAMHVAPACSDRSQCEGAVQHAFGHTTYRGHVGGQTFARSRLPPNGRVVDQVARDREPDLLEVGTAVTSSERTALLGPVGAREPRPDLVVVEVAVAVYALRLDHGREVLDRL